MASIQTMRHISTKMPSCSGLMMVLSICKRIHRNLVVDVISLNGINPSNKAAAIERTARDFWPPFGFAGERRRRTRHFSDEPHGKIARSVIFCPRTFESF